MADYNWLKNGFGMLSIITNAGFFTKETYKLCKERREFEYAFDALQNVLNAEITWIGSYDWAGFLFIMFVALSFVWSGA